MLRGPMRFPDPELLRGYALMLLAGLSGAVLFRLLHLPLPWLTGPMAAAAALAALGGPTRQPPKVREVAQCLLGVVIGQGLTPAVLVVAGQHLVAMMLGGLALVGIGFGLAWLLHRRAGLDPASAFFAAVPGGVAEMAVLSDRYAGKLTTVAVAQSIRVAFTVFFVPVGIMAADLHGAGGGDALFWHPDLPLALAAGLGSVALGFLLDRVRAPNPWLFAGMGVGAVVAAAGLGDHFMPPPLVFSAQLVLGVALGARFSRAILRQMAGFLPVAALAALALLMASAAVGLALQGATRLGLGEMLLATAPGGAAEMALTAQATQHDVGLVTAFQVVRLLLVLALCQPLFRVFQRLTRYR